MPSAGGARGRRPLDPRAYAASGRALPCTRAYAANGRALPCTRAYAAGTKGASPFGIPSFACGRDWRNYIFI